MVGKASTTSAESQLRLDTVFSMAGTTELSLAQSIIESWLSRVSRTMRFSKLAKHSSTLSQILSLYAVSIGTNVLVPTKLELSLVEDEGFLVTIGVEQRKDGTIWFRASWLT